MVAFDATWNCRLRESGGESREASQATGHEDVARGEGERRRGEASYGVPGPVRATTTTRGMRDRKGVRGTRRKSDREGKREREKWCGHRGEERRIRGKKREKERKRRSTATACVSRLNECKPRSGGSPLDLLFSSPDSL